MVGAVVLSAATLAYLASLPLVGAALGHGPVIDVALRHRVDSSDLTDEKPREVDDVRADVTQRPRPGDVAPEAPITSNLC